MYFLKNIRVSLKTIQLSEVNKSFGIMKKILFCFMMLCSISAIAKEDTKVLNDKFPIYEGVIYQKGSQSELQCVLREWIAVNFKSAQDVMQLDDVDSGTIIAKGSHTFNTQVMGMPIPNTLDFSLNIKFKEGRFKYKILITDVKNGTHNITVMNDVMLKDIPVKPNGKPYKGSTLKSVNKNKQKMLDEIELYKNDLISRLENIEPNKNEDDW